jgi:hypothetical protein
LRPILTTQTVAQPSPRFFSATRAWRCVSLNPGSGEGDLSM